MLDVTVIYSTISFVAEIFRVHQYPATLLGTHTLMFGTTNGLTSRLKHCMAFVSPVACSSTVTSVYAHPKRVAQPGS